MKRKIILISIDGLADGPIPAFRNKTPLEFADTPNLDFLAKNGICGLVIPWVKKGEMPSSEDTHLAIFGYNPNKCNPGRGVLEALGIMKRVEPNLLCIRGNFSTVDEKMRIIDRRAGRINETESLIRSLNKIRLKNARIKVKKSFSYRVVVFARGRDLSPAISSNDPKRVGEIVRKIEAKNKNAKKTADILNEFLEVAHSVLQNHPLNKRRIKEGKMPANYILLRGAGKFKKIESFYKRYGLKAGFIAGGVLYRGIGRYLGMKEIFVKNATGLADTNLFGKFEAARRSISRFDFIFLHIKPVDTFGEDGDYWGKKEYIEKIDSALSPLMDLRNVMIVITGDHPTFSLKKSHWFAPNPILIFGTKEKDNTQKFSERDCKRGVLGVISQLSLMKKILKMCIDSAGA